MNGGRRFLIAAGTANYPQFAGLDGLPSVGADHALIVECFTTQLGYTRALPDFGIDPSAAPLREELGKWLQSGELQEDDCVVLYYSGHGVVQGDELFLLTADSKPAGVSRGDQGIDEEKAISARTLARRFALSPVRQALVIVDTCYSGKGLEQFLGQACLLLQASGGAGAAIKIYVMAAARPKEIADEGVFARALVEVIKNREGKLGGQVQPYLDPSVLVGAVNDSFKDSDHGQRALWAGFGTGGLPPFVRNVLWVEGRPSGLDLEEGRISSATAAGARSDALYFTGREQALREIARWLAGPRPDGKLRLITGAAGTGKSALLARIVALSDPAERRQLESTGLLAGLPPETLVPVGSIDGFVSARGKTLADLTAAISVALGEPPGESVASLLTALRGRGRFAIVVDALDESIERGKIARELLRQLAALPHGRVLVGSRPERIRGPMAAARLASLGADVVEIDLDAPEYLGPDDVQEFVTRSLLAQNELDLRTPYRDRPALARHVARAVARKAGHVFLIAHIVSRTLRDAETAIEPDALAGHDFPDEVGRAFDGFLDRFDHDQDFSKRAVVDLLRPLALSFGVGLPWFPLWVRLATALTTSGDRYYDDDVKRMLERAGAFVIESSEQERSVYRLYHEALAEFLRAGLDVDRCHRVVAQTLIDTVPRTDDGRPDWRQAQPYVLMHLASHAAVGQSLDLLVMDPLFLAAADRRQLLRALSQIGARLSGEGPWQCASVYELASYHLGTPDVGERLAYLELAAHQQRSGHVYLHSTRGRRLSQPWGIRWSAWNALAENRVLMQGGGAVRQLLFTAGAGRPLLIAISREQWKLFDLRDGELVYEPFDTSVYAEGYPQFSLCGMALASSRGDTVLVAGIQSFHAYEAQLAVWRLSDGQQSGDFISLGFDRFSALAALDTAAGGLVAVSGRHSRSELAVIELWDIQTRTRLNQVTSEAYRGEDYALAAVEVGGSVLLLAGGSTGDLRLWDITAEKLLAEADVEEPSISHIAARLVGKDLKIVVAADERLSVWEMTAEGLARAHEGRAGHADGVLTLALDEWNGEPVYISGGRDNTVRVWRLSDSELLLDTLLGFSGDASAATLVKLQDEHALATGDTTGAVRLWKGRGPAGTAGASRFDAPSVDELTTITWDGREYLFMRSRSGALLIVDAATGEQHPLPDWAQRGNFIAAVAANIDGRALLAACDDEGIVTIWDLAQGSAVGRPLSVHVHTRRLRLVSRNGRLLVVVLRSGNQLDWHDVGAGALEAATPLKDISGAWDLDIAPLGGGFVAVVCGENHLYECWQWPDEGGEPSLFPLPFWTSGIGALATVGGQTVLAHAATSSEVTVAQLEPYREIVRLHGQFFDPRKLALREQDGDLLVACGLANGTLLVWRSSSPIAEIETGCTIAAVAITHDRGVVVAGNEGVLMFDIARLSTTASSRAAADSRPPYAPSP